LSSSATVTPVIPPPTIATSTSRSRSSLGKLAASDVASQSDSVAVTER
jgi:hypothetical protein